MDIHIFVAHLPKKKEFSKRNKSYCKLCVQVYLVSWVRGLRVETPHPSIGVTRSVTIAFSIRSFYILNSINVCQTSSLCSSCPVQFKIINAPQIDTITFFVPRIHRTMSYKCLLHECRYCCFFLYCCSLYCPHHCCCTNIDGWSCLVFAGFLVTVLYGSLVISAYMDTSVPTSLVDRLWRLLLLLLTTNTIIWNKEVLWSLFEKQSTCMFVSVWPFCICFCTKATDQTIKCNNLHNKTNKKNIKCKFLQTQVNILPHEFMALFTTIGAWMNVYTKSQKSAHFSSEKS